MFETGGLRPGHDIMITQLTESAQLYLKLLKTESSVILFVRFTYFKYLACMYVCVLMCMHGGCGRQKTLDPQELESQNVVSCHVSSL